MGNISKKMFHFISTYLNSKGIHLIRSLQYSSRDKLLDRRRLDYIRISTLELCSYEIMKNRVPGNVAELGVYQGDFAKDINKIFYDRKLYLFDTFKGFNKNDIDREKKESLSSADQDFSDTSVEMVLSKMEHSDKCVICKGFFPKTAKEINDDFCFVSIDADLYQPIADGLEYFYPRLSKGGYIFVHDFNNEGYPGAEKAVIEFCKKENISYMPIADIAGTVVITK